MTKKSIAIVLLLLIVSNIITSFASSEIIIRTVAYDLAFSTNTVLVDDGRFTVIDNRQRALSFYDRRSPFGTPTRFVEGIDLVPTAESAVRIADVIAASMTCEDYGNFNPLNHDAYVRFFEEDNVWEVFYRASRLSGQSALFIARGGWISGLGRQTAGPSFIINKTTGEITVLHEGSSLM
ncbi:MAG: hypothetical protein FWC70_12140 [Defluviitaleaceae bacterium]|nr:hypothetical protein [Defluviitaleaceae bacterium]